MQLKRSALFEKATVYSYEVSAQQIYNLSEASVWGLWEQTRVEDVLSSNPNTGY